MTAQFLRLGKDEGGSAEDRHPGINEKRRRNGAYRKRATAHIRPSFYWARGRLGDHVMGHFHRGRDVFIARHDGHRRMLNTKKQEAQKDPGKKQKRSFCDVRRGCHRDKPVGPEINTMQKKDRPSTCWKVN